MSAETLKEQVDNLKSTLQAIEGELAQREVPREGLEDLKRAVDNIRRTVWALITAAEAPDEYVIVLARLRLNRAMELCQQVVLDINASFIPIDSAELRRFHVTMKGTVDRVERLMKGGM